MNNMQNFLNDFDTFIIDHKIDINNVIFDIKTRAKYSITGPNNEYLGHIEERSRGTLGLVARQATNLNRAFNIDVFNPQGQVLITAKRSFQFITSKVLIIHNGYIIGKSVEKFTLLKRKYDLFIAKKPIPMDSKPSDDMFTKFGEINAPPIIYNFPIKNDKSNIIASIDRKWSGVATEFFTDGGVYVIRTGEHSGIQEMYKKKPTYLERMPWEYKAILLGCAISIDFDYFDRNSRNNY